MDSSASHLQSKPNRAPTEPSESPADAGMAVLQLIMGTWASQVAGTLARLRVFDEVARGHRTAREIAEQLQVDPGMLHRVMRAGAMLGLLRGSGPHGFELTPQGELLRSHVPGSMRALLDVETAPGHWLPWGCLDECVRRGRTVAADALGRATVWDYYRDNPEEARTFSEGMSDISAMAIAAISAVWTPPRARYVVDVGGAHGALLGWVLSQLPQAQGIILDLPHVVETAQAAVASSDLSQRVECVAGDFFEAVPSGGDLYLLKHIVHDWDDTAVKNILSNVRQAMAPGATVTVVEMLIPEDGTPSPAILMDINMLVMLPGRERTLSEMRQLFSSTGLTLTRAIPTASPYFVLEARAA